MCGITGMHSIKKVNTKFILNSCLKMNKRGPDNSEILSLSNNICFGHVRLSIIDITDDSNQPFNSICGNYSITFNGEIYNFKEIKSMLEDEGCKFRTNGDTEVLLQLYIKKGNVGLKYLRGMFAFCIWDNVKKIFFIARDIAGEKPLFYCKTDSSFGFASTLTALMELKIVPNIIDPSQVLNYLHDGYSEGSKSLIKNIQKIEPGTFLEYNFKNKSIKIKRYWTTPKYNRKLVVKSLDNYLLSILEKYVEEQLFADVQTSVLLSGGLDSSLVTALASTVKNNVQTFSVSFSNDKKNDEIDHANKIARYYNTSHNILNVGEASLEALIEICEQIDEPFIDSSMIPTFFLAKEVGKHTKVVLGGDGADELFGGYKHYNRLVLLNKLHKNPILRKTLNSTSFIIDRFESDTNEFKWLNILFQNLNNTVPQTAVYFRNPHKLLKSSFKIKGKKIEHDNRLLEASMEFDFKNYLSSDILVKVDRAMMSASVESRSPFLDKRVIEFAFSRTPVSEKVDKSNGKIILQKIAKKLLPKDFDFGRKQGFNFNIGALMAKNEVISYMYDELNVSSFFENFLFKDLVNKNKLNHNHGEKLYGLFVLAFWIKKNKVEWIF